MNSCLLAHGNTAPERATLYAVHTSHPAHAARLMLEHKRIEHRVVNLVPGSHAAVVRAMGFRSGTVPALRLDGRRIQGTRDIARALDRTQPEPPLFPADPQKRLRVEEAEWWCDDVLQRVPRRLGNWIFAHRAEMRARLVREAGLPAPRLLGLAGWPLTVLRAKGRRQQQRSGAQYRCDAARPERQFGC